MTDIGVGAGSINLGKPVVAGKSSEADAFAANNGFGCHAFKVNASPGLWLTGESPAEESPRKK